MFPKTGQNSEKNKMRLLIIPILLLAVITASAQATTELPQVGSAITQLGDEINLKGNGTWAYVVRKSPKE
jgi:hypothetical protein